VKQSGYGSIKRGRGLAWARLWRARLDVDATVEVELGGELTAEETARAERFARPEDRRRFVVARGVLRMLLGSILGENPRSIPIDAGPSGKPRLADAEHGVFFNVSHSRDEALVCIAGGGEVGVDLEAVRPVRSAVAIARQRFASAETSFIEAGATTGEVNRRFLLCWTRKEALAKAVGAGLSFDLRRIGVPLAAAGGLVSIGDREGTPSSQRWLLVNVPLGAEHVATLALPASALAGNAPAAPEPERTTEMAPAHCEEIDMGPLISRVLDS